MKVKSLKFSFWDKRHKIRSYKQSTILFFVVLFKSFSPNFQLKRPKSYLITLTSIKMQTKSFYLCVTFSLSNFWKFLCNTWLFKKSSSFIILSRLINPARIFCVNFLNAISLAMRFSHLILLNHDVFLLQNFQNYFEYHYIKNIIFNFSCYFTIFNLFHWIVTSS